MNANISKLDMWSPKFPDNFSMAICASRRSGKTTMLKHLINDIKNRFDEIVLICTTLNNDIYTDFPSSITFSEFEPEIIKGLIAIQKEDKSKKILVIFDDTVGNKVKYNDTVLQLFACSRNLNMSVIFSVQSATMLLPDHKENLDLLIVMKIKTFPKLKHVVETFLMGSGLIDGDLRKQQEFEQYVDILRENTEDYNAVVIDYMVDKILKYHI